MNERDFSAGGRDFRLSKLDAFKQFHIVRRLGPILGDVIPAAQKAVSSNKESASDEEKLQTIAALAAPIMNGLSKLSDQDANTVLIGLLSCVEMRQDQAKNWAKLVVGESLMFNDLELPLMLQVAGRSFMYNLSGFFSFAHPASQGGK